MIKKKKKRLEKPIQLSKPKKVSFLDPSSAKLYMWVILNGIFQI